MAEYMTTKEAALLWNISERRVSILCREGRIEGVNKENNVWLIPEDTAKPADNRVKSGLYKKSTRPPNLPLPVGISDYRLASTEYYYVDKTMMIRDFLDERPMVSLFTKPRRFGKTLILDMLRTFFEKTDEDTSVYFADKKIWNCGKKYQDHQGKYPVIFLSLKDIKRDNWEDAYRRIVQLIRVEYQRHPELAGSARIQNPDFYQKMTDGTVDAACFDSSLYMLSKMLHEHHGVAPVIMIDEYDVPLWHGYRNGYEDKMNRLLGNLFSGAFKDNRHLSFGFLTGVFYVGKEKVFDNLNHLEIYSAMDSRYGSFFGFTEEEVIEMAEYYGAVEQLEEIHEWYGGYRLGRMELYNPWSVINYFSHGCVPEVFEKLNGSNNVIGELLAQADGELYETIFNLIHGELMSVPIDMDAIEPQTTRASSMYSLLMAAGYLSAVRLSLAYDGDYICEVSIPNEEIAYIYNREILHHAGQMIPQKVMISIQDAVRSGDSVKLQTLIQSILTQSLNAFESDGEHSYHGFILALSVLLDDSYTTFSREKSDGRCDIQLIPKKEHLSRISIELKLKKPMRRMN